MDIFYRMFTVLSVLYMDQHWSIFCIVFHSRPKSCLTELSASMNAAVTHSMRILMEMKWISTYHRLRKPRQKPLYLWGSVYHYQSINQYHQLICISNLAVASSSPPQKNLFSRLKMFYVLKFDTLLSLMEIMLQLCLFVLLQQFWLISALVILIGFQSKSNIITPRNGEPLIAAIQDFITGKDLSVKVLYLLN